MKKFIFPALLTICCVVLAVGLIFSKQENTRLQQKVATQETEPVKPAGNELHTDETPAAVVQRNMVSPEESEPPASEQIEKSARRMMSSMAQMMDNPTMNKMMVASQRGAVGALYADMIEYLDLNAEETKYFMDLLMYRQMKNVDLGMKMMSGQLSEEDKQELITSIKEADETMKYEMEAFLNNADDYAEFNFYEKTMGERMMLSSMDQKLAAVEPPIPDETYRDLLNLMHEEKENFKFTSDLHDQQNADLSPERFSKQNLENHATDLDQLNQQIIARAKGILSPEQLQAFIESIQATTEMQQAQLEMAAQMFGGGK